MMRKAYRKGAIGVLMDEYERAAAELRLAPVLALTKNLVFSNCRSLRQHIVIRTVMDYS